MKPEQTLFEAELAIERLSDINEEYWMDMNLYGYDRSRHRQSKMEADYDQHEDDYREDYLNGQS